MKFLKTNSYDIVRLFINQVGITILSMILYFTVAFAESGNFGKELRLYVSIFTIIFYLVLLYFVAWEFGSKDKMRADSGKIKLSMGKGALMSLCANSLNIILAGVCLICLFVAGDTAYTVFGVLNSIMRFISAMYIGLLQFIFAYLETSAPADYLIYQTAGYLILPFVSVLITHVGYWLGAKHIKLSAFLTSGKKK